MKAMYLHSTFRALIAGFLLVFAAGTAAAEDVAIADQEATQSVIQDQISAFQQSDFDRAFSHAAPALSVCSNPPTVSSLW